VTVSPNFRISEVDYAASKPGSTCFSPTYGDYNMLAVGPEFMYASWASPVSPPEILPASTSVDVFFAAIHVGDIPQIQPSGLLDYGDVCASATKDLTICNSGKVDLIVNGIGSSDPEFTVVSATFPLAISPDACFPVQIKFTPSSAGAKSSTLTITSNDPVNPSVTVQATGTGSKPIIATLIADGGDFGDVCLGSFKDQNLTISNSGGCTLSVNSIISLLPADFKTASAQSFPLKISAGGSIQVPIRFQPTTPGSKTTTITVNSNDLASPATVVIVSGNAPNPIASTSGALDFGQLCLGGEKTNTVKVCDTGKCNLTVIGASLTGQCTGLELVNAPVYPLTISPDFCFDFNVKFKPTTPTAPACALQISTDDPAHSTISFPITASVGVPNLVLDPTSLSGLYAFPATVSDPNGNLGCFSDRTLVVRNNGTCPATITGIAAAAPYSVVAPTQFPVTLPVGQETLNVTVRFKPTADPSGPSTPGQTPGTLTLTSTYGGAVPDKTAGLCGEAVVQNGMRVLVVDGLNNPINGLDTLTLTSKGVNTPSPISVRLKNVNPATTPVCGNTVRYHLDSENLTPTQTTGSNPRSSYSITAKEGNKQVDQSFTLGQCEFREFILRLQ